MRKERAKMTKEQIFRKLYTNAVKRGMYLGKIPRDINAAFFDNEYCSSLSMDIEMLMDEVFGDHAEAISWFLYDWNPGMICRSGESEHKIDSIDQYIEFMKKHEGF